MTLEDMLNAIPWSEVGHAYGPAVDTPNYLRALLTDDEEARAHALWELWGSIYHQGSIYEASVPAASCLLEILPQVPDARKPSIIGVLAGLASQEVYAARGSRRQVLHWCPDNLLAPLYHAWWVPEARIEETDAGSHWMRLTHVRVAEGLPLYLRLLHAGDKPIVLATLSLLSAFREAHEHIVPAVEALLLASGSELIEAASLYCLASLLPSESLLWNHFTARTHATSTEGNQLPRYAAAIGIATHCPRLLDTEGAVLLEQAIRSPKALDKTHRLLPWHERVNGSVHIEACRALCNADTSLALELLSRLLRGSPRWNILNTIRVAEALLDSVFFGAVVEHRFWDYVPTTHVIGDAAPVKRMLRDGHHVSYYSYGRTYLTRRLRIACFAYAEHHAVALKHQLMGSISSAQRQALTAVLTCDALWQVPHNLLEIYGLPADREQALSFVARCIVS